MINIPVTLKALSDETRFEIIKLLLINDYCVGALANKLNVSKSAVSQHLKVLRQADLVKGEKRGYFTHYKVEKETLVKLSREILTLSEIEPTISDCINNCCNERRT